jgi:type II pantothenate kinase
MDTTAIESASAETTLPLLADAAGYEPATWELTYDEARRGYWVDLFRDHFPKLLAEAEREAADLGQDLDDLRQRGEAAERELSAYLDDVSAQPAQYAPLTILDLCWQRERVLRRHGFEDPYRLAKKRENEQSLGRLPAVLAELDALPPAQQREAVVRGLFAGNIFDLGASKTIDMFQDGNAVDFHGTLAKLKPRPWFVDDLDAWLERLQGPAHRAALIFVDNAGPDVVLGIMPFARMLLQRGTRVILTANSAASLNDVTYEELVELIEQINDDQADATLQTAWQNGELQVVPSGNWAPLIDFRRVSPELVDVVQREQVDLAVIEGMGRALETNFKARFTCETLKLAMIKDQGVAQALGAAMFDLVFKYEPRTSA